MNDKSQDRNEAAHQENAKPEPEPPAPQEPAAPAQPAQPAQPEPAPPGPLDIAVALAADGNYAEAGKLLDALEGDERDSLGAILLRARIRAQQGNQDEAIALWRKALAKEPGNRDARRGLALSIKLMDTYAGNYYLRANIVIGALLLLVLLLAIALLRG